MSNAVQKFNPKGLFHFQQFRNGEKINDFYVNNGITDGGVNDLLDVSFGAGTQKTVWYIGLIDDPATLAAADTPASHAGWTEFTEYNNIDNGGGAAPNRSAWADDAAASRSKTNSTPSSFDINATGSVHGIFIASVEAKSAITGILWSTAAFSSPVDVVNGDTIRITYTLSA